MPNIIEVEIDQEKLSKLYFLAFENNGKFSGMSYEQGLQAMIDVIEGNADIDELIEDYS